MRERILCEQCITYLRTKGSVIYKGNQLYTMEEEADEGIVCEWCDEVDDLYDCKEK